MLLTAFRALCSRFSEPQPRVSILGPRIDNFLEGAYAFVNDRTDQWSLEQDVELDLTNRVMRVFVLDKTIGKHSKLVRGMCNIQHSDGGWGERRDEKESRMRSSAFCTQMLVRANRGHYSEFVTRSILRGLDYLVRSQKYEGSWIDHKAHELEVTSVALGALLHVVGQEGYGNSTHRIALQRGIQYVEKSRAATRVWYRSVAASPVSITAHLVQKCVAYSLPLTYTMQTIEALLDMQSPEGYWDRGDIGNTCDATRSVLLCATALRDDELVRRVAEASSRALNFVLDRVQDGGLGERRTVAPDVQRTCAGIETVLRMEKYFEASPVLLRFWH